MAKATTNKYAHQFLWIDLETTSLPEEGDGIIDFREVHVLEIALIITDFDLNPGLGYSEVVKMTKPAAASLRANEFVLNMHRKNGLVKDSMEADKTLEEIDAEIDEWLRTETPFDKGEFMIAGSGVAMFDYNLIKAKMPKLASWLVYYPGDIGVFRRMSKILAGRDIINPVKESYQDDVKAHRAMDDVRAHLREAQRFRDFLRSIPQSS